MQKASSSIQQEEFSYQEIEDMYYIYIYENEVYVPATEDVDAHYEYDFNHIIIPNDESALFSKIQRNPNRYLDYTYKPVTQIELMQAQIAYLMGMV